MKNLIILCAILVAIVTACKSDNVRPFIPGTYINNADSEFSRANDTLVIEPSESNNFYLHRKTGFNLISNRKIGKREYETENWNAVYDEATKTLTETKKGKLITFYPDSAKLMVGKRMYQKIN
ncbi:MAG: hypothetical protein WC622_03570 [Pedobacter sp.]|jgi:hypothetical protein|uniref:hypothetical protein n=1 Tax=Pedobacter sp. TaxID=1411316 RepID=UPI00356A0139